MISEPISKPKDREELPLDVESVLQGNEVEDVTGIAASRTPNAESPEPLCSKDTRLSAIAMSDPRARDAPDHACLLGAVWILDVLHVRSVKRVPESGEHLRYRSTCKATAKNPYIEVCSTLRQAGVDALSCHHSPTSRASSAQPASRRNPSSRAARSIRSLTSWETAAGSRIHFAVVRGSHGARVQIRRCSWAVRLGLVLRFMLMGILCDADVSTREAAFVTHASASPICPIVLGDNVHGGRPPASAESCGTVLVRLVAHQLVRYGGYGG